jgi:hypothetical protein
VTVLELKPFRDEAAFQRHVESLASMLGWRSFHVSDSRKVTKRGVVGDRRIKGFPDLVLIKPLAGHRHAGSPAADRVLFRELKTDTGRLSPEQREVLEQLAAAGANVDVWRPADLGRIEQELKSA